MKIILKKRKKNKRKGERKLIERGGEVERKERESAKQKSVPVQFFEKRWGD